MKEIERRSAARSLNITTTIELRQALLQLMDQGSRIDANKGGRYWYPLSIATYGVDEVLAAVDSLCSFRTTMWSKTAEFERRFAARGEVKEAVMVNSGSSADLLIAFAAVDPNCRLLTPGDEVLVPSVTWPTQIWSLLMAGLRVRFVDTDPRTLNMDLADLERKIGPRTRALSLVHLMGNPNDMDEVTRIRERYDLVLFEDCCEALGASFRGRPVGTFGVASAFSFFFSHHITTMEGGMICTADEALSDVFRLLRAHGWSRNTKYSKAVSFSGLDERYMFRNWGFNVRPTEIQAAFGLEQLERLPEFAAMRASNVAHALERFRPLTQFMSLMRVHAEAEASWFALPVMLSADCPFARDDLVAHLEASGVETRPIVAGNLARQPVCELFPDLQGMDLPGADAVHDRGFYVGLYPVDMAAMIDQLTSLITDFAESPSKAGAGLATRTAPRSGPP